MKTLIRGFCALSILIAASAVVSAHQPSGGIFPVFQFPENALPRIDGDLSDWDMVPEKFWITLDNNFGKSEVMPSGAYTYHPIWRDFDLADLNVKCIVGWNEKTNRIYVMAEVVDDYLHNSRENPSRYDWDDDINLVIDADHSGGKLFKKRWEYLPREEQEQLFYTTGQLYTMLVPPIDGYYSFMYFLDGGTFWWLTDGTRDLAPDYLKTGWTRTGETGGPGTYTYEFMVTPWELLSPGGPDSSTIVDLEEGKIIHLGFLFKDYDTFESYEGSYDFPPMHEVWRNADLAADFVLLPIGGDLRTIAGTVTNLRHYRKGVPLLKDLPGWFFGLRYLFGVSRKDLEPYGGLVIEAYRGDQPAGSAHTDAEGQYNLMVMPGEYTLGVPGVQGVEAPQVAGLTVRAGQETNADFEVTPVELPKVLEPSIAGYQLKWYNEPLMKTELSIIHMSFGVDVKRYSYEIPDFHYICYSYERYIEGQKQQRLGRDGELIDWTSGGISGTSGGKNIISLIFRRTDEMLHIWHATKGGGGTLGRVNIEGYYPRGDVRYGESLAVGKRSLVHVWVADSAGNIERYLERGRLSPQRTVEEIASEYGLVVAIYAELECKEAEWIKRKVEKVTEQRKRQKKGKTKNPE